MKLPASLAILICWPLLTAWADLEVHFGDEAYAIGGPLIGVDGWQPRLAAPPPIPDSARVVKARWAAYRPVAMLKGASLKRPFDPPRGGRVSIRVELALTFPEGGRPCGRSAWVSLPPSLARSSSSRDRRAESAMAPTAAAGAAPSCSPRTR